MRRLALTVPFLMIVACAPMAAQAAEPDAAELRIAGTLDGTANPATFRLRTENGCPRDVKLATTTTGNAFSVALAAGDLADVFACAIDVEAGDATLPTITVTPDAEAHEVEGMSLEPSFAVVAASLDPRDGHLVRFTVNAPEAIEDARVTLDGSAYEARIAPSEEGSDTPTSAIFDVPARAWASAVIMHELAWIDVKVDGGAHRAMTLHPTARIETIADDGD